MAQKIVSLEKEIVSYYQHLFTLIPIEQHIITHSGRACTKSTFWAMWHLWRMLYYPHAEQMILAYEYSSIKNKVFLDYKAAAAFLQIPEEHLEFHSTDNGNTWIKIKNKYGTNTIHFEHAKCGAEGLKGNRPEPGYRWLNVHYYELTNFINWNGLEITNNNATFIREAYGQIIWDEVKKYCIENKIPVPTTEAEVREQAWFFKNWEKMLSSEFCVTYEFNTPSPGISGGEWVMDWLDNQRKSPSTYYQFNDYEDMTEFEQFKFLGPQMLKEIENVKNTDPITYNHVYKGKAAYDGDLVYPQLNKSIHYGVHENFEPDLLIIGVDVGRSDATVCTLNGFEYEGKDLRVQLGMKRWSHSNRRAEFYKDGIRNKYKAYELFEYADMITSFIEEVHKEYPYAYIYFQMDYAGEGKAFYDAIFKFNKPLYLHINKSWEKALPSLRIDTICTMLTIPGVVKISDPILFSAFRNQVYSKRAADDGERKRLDDPTKQTLDMDSLDSCEYGFLKPMFNEIKTRIRVYGGKWAKN